MIAIIGAMQAETEALVSAIQNPKEETVSGIRYVSGKLCARDVVIATSGAGKVNAAVTAQTMILRYAPSLLINTGVGGTLTPELGIGDVAVATSLVQHDMDTSPVGDPLGFVSGINKIYFEADEKIAAALTAVMEKHGIHTKAGVIASGDQFIASPARKEFIRSQFGAIACEMEGAAIAHVAVLNGVPFAVLRAISDTADGNASVDYPTFVKRAAADSVRVLLDFLDAF